MEGFQVGVLFCIFFRYTHQDECLPKLIGSYKKNTDVYASIFPDMRNSHLFLAGNFQFATQMY